ncbi:Uncharacterised protein [Vibrio cholerae]|uniref:Uncharacterized protein n=1 Tax=Vibrio cholerae TaxID=666 RepID=A0A655T381_VIBCL|nr:Uncharacterised protein [Vibrio cholerae]CSB39373.1 Uncharacterised protein [Vibrio cholerae]CSC28949.1 Uncharacterised protein [Vibrio cholerae]CSC62162.1 Uncharacterised protein [Vibrio cholerae]CSI56432.1 Uncharacterised protein [Vibrio cholerae]
MLSANAFGAFSGKVRCQSESKSVRTNQMMASNIKERANAPNCKPLAAPERLIRLRANAIAGLSGSLASRRVTRTLTTANIANSTTIPISTIQISWFCQYTSSSGTIGTMISSRLRCQRVCAVTGCMTATALTLNRRPSGIPRAGTAIKKLLASAIHSGRKP